MKYTIVLFIILGIYIARMGNVYSGVVYETIEDPRPNGVNKSYMDEFLESIVSYTTFLSTNQTFSPKNKTNSLFRKKSMINTFRFDKLFDQFGARV